MSDIKPSRPRPARWLLRSVGAVLAIYLVGVLALMWWWSYEPEQFDVVKLAQEKASAHQQQVVTGSA